MLSVQSSSLYRSRGIHCRNSYTEDQEEPSTEVLVSPRIQAEIKTFPTDGFLDHSNSAPTVASMAAIILSSSPDLASSFFNGYFRSDPLHPTITARKTTATIKSTLETKQIPKTYPRNLNHASQKKKCLKATKPTDVNKPEKEKKTNTNKQNKK